MKKFLSLTVLFCLCMFIAYGAENNKAATTSPSPKKVLVAFFSRTGENYAVGSIKKGNTHFVAEMIAAETSGKLFEIKTKTPYSDVYSECVEVAKQEKNTNARPEIQSDIAVEDYDVIFIGYPIWCGDMPMAVYTFIEKHQWQGKTVIPFCTHEGSGLTVTEDNVKKACKGSTVLKDLAVKGNVAQNDQPQAKQTVSSWIRELKY